MNKEVNNTEKPQVNIYAEDYIKKFWYEQPRDIQRKMQMAYIAGFIKSQPSQISNNTEQTAEEILKKFECFIMQINEAGHQAYGYTKENILKAMEEYKNQSSYKEVSIEETLRGHYEYKDRMMILKKHLKSDFYKTGQYHSAIDDAFLELLQSKEVSEDEIEKAAEGKYPYRERNQFNELMTAPIGQNPPNFKKYERLRKAFIAGANYILQSKGKEVKGDDNSQSKL